MNKLYNTENDIVKGLIDFFNKIDFNFSKPQLKIVPHIISSIINSENITTLDISKSFIDDSLLSNQSSIEKKLWRFFNNPKFNGISFFNSSIKYIINNYKALKHNKFIIIIDHVFTKNNFVNSNIKVYMYDKKEKHKIYKKFTHL